MGGILAISPPSIRPNTKVRPHTAAAIIDKIYIIVRKTDSEHSQLSFFNSSMYINVKTIFVITAAASTETIGTPYGDLII
jgi:hypothetical protein